MTSDEESRFGHYVRLGKLGAGGFGDVYLARDERLGREVALKMLPKAFARDGEQMQRFRREALVLASLNHPNIAIIYGFEEDESGAMAIALERIEGESLSERLRRGALPVPEALQVCAQIAEALEVAHERNIVHRDLKPGNVMLGPRGLVKVLDFGLARQMDMDATVDVAALTAPPAGAASAAPPTSGDDDQTIVMAPPTRGGDDDATIVVPTPARGADDDATMDVTLMASRTPLTLEGVASGTPGYMSPEQVRGAVQDHRTDVFAFGCVLYECLTGRHAIGGKTPVERMANAVDQVVDMTALPERTPADVRALLERCLEKDVERRLPEIRSARHTLEDVLGIRRAAALRAGEAAAIPTNLPQPATSFVGRERERAEALRRLAETRLLTLAAMGGSGKTRLAIEVARAALDDHPDGVWFVDLTAQQHGERVPEALAQAVGVAEEAGVPLERTLTSHFRDRRALLVVDNCEDVLAAVGGLVSRLLEASTGLRVLATSREALGIAGEVVISVPPLGIPDGGGASNLAALAANDAVRLFVQRATIARADFALSAENAAPIAEICRRLDGIPLAIELAAARVRLISPAQIRDRLGDRFKLLTASGGAAGRHQTLRATVQWSVDQLNDDEREVFMQLGVFVTPWTLASAVAITGGRDEFEVLDGLSRLADKSLVIVQAGGADDARYRYLETVRVFALELLTQSGQPVAVRDRHLDYFVGVAETSLDALAGPQHQRWLDQLDREHDDTLAAHHWCGDGGGPERALKDLRLVGSLWRFWSARSHYALARRTLAEALARPDGRAPSPARAAALVRAGGFALLEGDHEGARPWIEESLVVGREIGDRRGVARSLSGLATIAIFRGDLAEARERSLESLAVYKELGQGLAPVLHNLGDIAAREDNLDLALSRFEEALTAADQAGDKRMMALTLTDLARVALRRGETEASRMGLAAALGLSCSLDARRQAVYAMEGAAALAATLGEPVLAAGMLGAAASIRSAIGSPLLASEQVEQAALVDRLGQAAGEASIAEAFETGRRETFEVASQRVLGWLDRGAGSTQGPPARWLPRLES